MKRKVFVITVALLMLLSIGLVCATGQKEGAKAPFEQRYENLSWDQIVAEAKGETVYWYMWGGSDAINTWVNTYVTNRLKKEYGVTLKMVPVTGPTVFINKVLGEKKAGKDTKGSVDLVWVNGENFRTMRDAKLLFGPFAKKLPNSKYVDWTNSSIAYDFGYPVDGYESPYGSAQVVMIYDSAKVPNPPTTIGGLINWIKANPGKFTYPAIPDFTGSVFVRHLFYYVGGGYKKFLGPFNQQVFDEYAPKLWKLLNDAKPYLWREGKTYPENHTKLRNLFSNGEVYFDVDYSPNSAANLIKQGRYPESARTFVFDSGTIGNTHYVAIPYNSSAKAGAMVLANLLLDPATQYSKAQPKVWGDLTALDVSKLPKEWKDKFNSIPRPPSVLSPEVLTSHKIPELQAGWLEAIEKGWVKNVLRK